MQWLSRIYNLLLQITLKIYNHRLIYPWFHPLYTIVSDTLSSYTKRKVYRLAAALAYYTIFSLPAIIIIIISLVGFFLGEAAVKGEVYGNIVEVVGEDAAMQIQNAVKNIGTPDTNLWATVLGISFLIFLATGVFFALQEALNMIFGVREVPRKVRIVETAINRILSLGMLLSIGGLLLVSIILNTVLFQLSNYINANEDLVLSKIPDVIGFIKPYLVYFTDYFLVFLNLGVSIFLITLFFASLYRILPAINLPWKVIWAGSFYAAIMFWIGELAMGYYLSRAEVISAYGAAGSLIALLVWVYYSSQLIFLGAEFMRAFCNFKKIELRPKAFAVMLHSTKQKNKISEKIIEQGMGKTSGGWSTPEERKAIEFNTIPLISDIR